MFFCPKQKGLETSNRLLNEVYFHSEFLEGDFIPGGNSPAYREVMAESIKEQLKETLDLLVSRKEGSALTSEQRNQIVDSIQTLRALKVLPKKGKQ